MAVMEKSQRQVLIEALQRIQCDVTADDRKAFFDAKLGSHTTVVRYLQGNVLDNDTALKILSFFTSRINSRQQQINLVTA